jgi:AcrR family transcriptional regulator
MTKKGVARLAVAAEYNLLGQRMGSKGRQVRDRLLVAARDLMCEVPTRIPTLTAITAAAGIQLTTVYRYYEDIGALLIDAMRPLEQQMLPVKALLEKPWPGGQEYRHALAFARALYEYWRERTGALFVRNSLAERGDVRFIKLRTEWALPMYHALSSKLALAHGRSSFERDLAMSAILISGMERTITLSLQRQVHAEDIALPGANGTLLVPAKQQVAVAQLITTLLRHDYLES